MTPFVVAAFKDRRRADAAVERLRAGGPTTREVRVDTAPDVMNAAVHRGRRDGERRLLRQRGPAAEDLLGYPPDDRHAVDYDDLAHKEARVVTVVLDSGDAAQEVADLLAAAGADRVSALPQPGLDNG
jgi:hypothetical protein